MISITLTSILFTLVASLNEVDSFREWMTTFNKSYKTEAEWQHRFSMWIKNFEHIQQSSNNQLQLGLNKFSDLSIEEFNALYNSGYAEGKRNRNAVNYELLNVERLQHSIDWRERNVISEVKDQGVCGSCWAFATAGTLEATQALQTNSVVSLSSQQMVDCCRIQNYGCNGGDPEPALKCIIRDGIMSDAHYPYDGKFSKQCRKNSDQIRFKPNNYILVIPRDPSQLKAALNIQPVAVCINSDSEAFQHYKGGIIKENDCRTAATHCVLAIGYGSEDNVDYWLLKNSWGPDWGENGYFRLERNDNSFGLGTCGILSEPMFSQ